ncbi:hypothetical protein A3K93_01710 [Acinetobacter sp. NCu2D-2]|uniref:RsiV family protein n=1 Tax=Acinetobacter sp. NCu2D-2 TaxID=1608473 RepID=UPI0007CDA378|nr:RsiV family protein [Acinetobacter sp. NCu2D-2]ANF81031.1 hypothetical protein A3K93_01710 [Acinetobacter sp. NCu2D-2]
MQHYKKLFGLSVLASALMLSACQPKKTEPEQSAASEVQAEVEQLKLTGNNQKLKLVLTDCDGKNCPEINIERLNSNQAFIDQFIDEKIVLIMQTILSPDALAQVQVEKKSDQEASSASEATLAAVETPKQKLEQQVQPYIESLLKLDQELKQLSANHSISVMISPKILNADQPLATVVMNSSQYLGGAHGSSAQSYYNFDLETKKLVQLDDILAAKQKANLQAKAYEAFKNWVIDSKLATDVAEYEQAWKFSLTDNFYLSKQGLVLQYAEYEIGPYVVGLPRLVIPYDQLQGILKPQYLPQEAQAASETKPASTK